MHIRYASARARRRRQSALPRRVGQHRPRAPAGRGVGRRAPEPPEYRGGVRGNHLTASPTAGASALSHVRGPSGHVRERGTRHHRHRRQSAGNRTRAPRAGARHQPGNAGGSRAARVDVPGDGRARAAQLAGARAGYRLDAHGDEPRRGPMAGAPGRARPLSVHARARPAAPAGPQRTSPRVLERLGGRLPHPDPDTFLRVGVVMHSYWRDPAYMQLVEEARVRPRTRWGPRRNRAAARAASRAWSPGGGSASRAPARAAARPGAGGRGRIPTGESTRRPDSPPG
jgi:hypothetical protein